MGDIPSDEDVANLTAFAVHDSSKEQVVVEKEELQIGAAVYFSGAAGFLFGSVVGLLLWYMRRLRRAVQRRDILEELKDEYGTKLPEGWDLRCKTPALSGEKKPLDGMNKAEGDKKPEIKLRPMTEAEKAHTQALMKGQGGMVLVPGKGVMTALEAKGKGLLGGQTGGGFKFFQMFSKRFPNDSI